jgi:hypothetical protein
MSGPASAPATFYRPAEVAAMLRCSEWWVKEQARRRRIPYSWIGGSYLFTQEHITEIVRLFEVQPVEARESAVETAPRRRREGSTSDSTTPVRLVARTPRRAREAAASKSAAA